MLDARAAKQEEDARSWGGLRDPADLQGTWPELWAAMVPITKAIHKVRDRMEVFRGLSRCFGKNSAKQRPTEDQISQLRAEVASSMGLTPQAAEEKHQHSPWRPNLVRAIQGAAGDPDTAIQQWLAEGAPMGIRLPIEDGKGAFPLAPSPASLSPEAVLAFPSMRNRQSFCELQGQQRPPGLAVLDSHVKSGFGLLFSDRSSAETFLKSACAPAPPWHSQ